MIVRMAFRNLWRHKRRTILTTLTIAVGLMVYLMADALYKGMDRQMIENVVKYAGGSLSVATREYANEENAFPLRYFLAEKERLVGEILGFDQVMGVAFRTPFLTEIIHGDKSLHVMGYVIDATQDAAIFELEPSLLRGAYLAGRPGEMLMGKDLARELGVDVGDEIIVHTQTKHGMLNAQSLIIAGIIRTTHPQIDESTIFISRETAKELLALEEGDAAMLHVRLEWPHGESVESYERRTVLLAERLRGIFPDHRVQTFGEKFAEVRALMELDRMSMYIILAVIFLIAGVGIVNTILMAIYERIREIGVMRAMGFTPRQIQGLFMLEGGLLGFLGGFLGLFLGVLVNLWQVYEGWNLEAIMGTSVSGSDFKFPVWGVIYGDWNLVAFAMAFAFAVVVSVVSAAIPATHSAKLSVTECMRSV